MPLKTQRARFYRRRSPETAFLSALFTLSLPASVPKTGNAWEALALAVS